MYGVYRDAQLQFNSSTETSTDHNTEPSLDIESMYKEKAVFWCTAKKDKIVENTCNTKI